MERFYRSDRTKDGLQYRCKSCFSAYYRNNRDRILPAANDYNSKPVNRERKRARDRERYWSAERVLTLNSCAACGQPFRGRAARACSDACSTELRLERWRSQNRRRRSYGIKREPYTLAAIARRDADTCHLCTFLVDMSLSGLDPWGPTVDHVLPLALGGDDTPANVKLAHRDCNIWKGARV